MAAWAYPCRLASDRETTYFVSQLDVDDLPPSVRIVRLRVGTNWLCATVDRTRRVQVESLLLRDVIASDADDCPECTPQVGVQDSAEPAATASPPGENADVEQAASRSPSRPREAAVNIQAAAISLQGIRFVVVAAAMSLVRSPGDAALVIVDLQERFGGVPVVLMAQDEAGVPTYYGDDGLLRLLAPIPLDKLPWKEYAIGD